MLTKLTERYDRGKSKKIKLTALCIKTVTGILGASAILTEQHPYVSLTILCIGALANEILNFIYSEEQESSTPPQP